jgi:hypothetical protein
MMQLIEIVANLLFFKSTCITVSTWQPRKEENCRDPFFSEVDDFEELEELEELDDLDVLRDELKLELELERDVPGWDL